MLDEQHLSSWKVNAEKNEMCEEVIKFVNKVSNLCDVINIKFALRG